jgi:hypothetical protein
MKLDGQQVVDHINKQLLKLSKTHPGKNVCVDFDSVLAHHEEGDPLHIIRHPLEPGLAIIRTARKLGLKPIVLTARSPQFHQKMEAFLKDNQAPAPVTNVKPPALMYIDDKAERYPENFSGKLRSFESAAQENGGDGSMNMLDGDRYMSLATHESAFLEHGVLGMKWGVHKAKDISGWKKVGEQKGSNPGGVYEDEEGFKYYVKFYKNPDQGRSEVLANNIYQELGVFAAVTQNVTLDGKDGVASAWLDGAKNTTAEEQKQNPDVKQGFVADAYLANHDVIGLNHENIVSGQGNFYRIDNGGSMFFRARGGDKAFTKEAVPELDSMRYSGMAKQAGPIFSQLSNGYLQPQAEALVSKLTNDKISELVAGAGFRGAEASKYEEALQGRRDAVAKYFGPGKPAVADTVKQTGDDDDKAKGGKSLKQTFLDKTPKDNRAGGYFLHSSTIGKLYNSLTKTEGEWTKISTLEEQHGGKASIKNRVGTLKSIGNWVGRWTVEVSGDSVRMFVNKGEQVVKQSAKSEEQETHEQQLASGLAKEYIAAGKYTGGGYVPEGAARPMFEKYYDAMGVTKGSVKSMEQAVKQWTGSVNLENSQAWREVAMKFYGRQPSGEHTGTYSKQIGQPDSTTKASLMKDGVMAMKAYASAYARETNLNTVYRGFNAKDLKKSDFMKELNETGHVSIPFNSLSSWSESKSTAKNFAHSGGVVIAMKVDPDNVWASHSATPWLFSAHSTEREIVIGCKQPVQKFKKEDVTFV